MQDNFKEKTEQVEVRLRGIAGGLDYAARVAQDALEVIQIQQTALEEYSRRYEGEVYADVIIGAVRYGIGRKSYYPLALLQALKPTVPKMTTSTLSCIVDEIVRNRDVILMDQATAEHWNELMTVCREELMKRI